MLQEHDVDFDEVRYLKDPPSRETLQAIVAGLDGPVADLVRQDKFFADQGYDPAELDDPERVVDLLVEHPRLLQRPVLVHGDHAVIGRPKGRTAEFLEAEGLL